MAITSFYLLNMFPQMRTSSSVNIQHPVLDTQIKHLLLNEHFIINQYSSPNTQTKHVPSDAYFTSTPNIQHQTLKQNMFPRLRTSSSVNIQHPVPDTQTKHLLLDEHFIITQYSSPNNQTKHVPSDAHFASFGKLLS